MPVIEVKLYDRRVTEESVPKMIEALTNALKHARATRADVTVSYAPGVLELEVRDDGRGGAKGDGAGYGLIGIRERVKIYGGEMTAARASGGGFVLKASLPR